MTEYWKSQARKYCEFCKCWFGDNKVSISFHENGKRHKESVQKHISQLTKRSAKDAKQQDKVDDDMKKMEAAALAAYAKDVQNNADLTSQYINEMLGNSSKSEPIAAPKAVPKAAPKPAPTWHEVRNDDGSSYYWNTESNETTWDPPYEYVSVAEQEEKELKEKEEKKKKEEFKKQKQKDEADAKKQELKAFMAREKMKQRAVKSEPEMPAAVQTSFGPAPRSVKPYGSWKAVASEPTPQLDLQLPKVKELPPPPVIVQPEVYKFGEKKIESLGDGPVEFKKRKLNNSKRNMRQKVDDD